VQVIPGREKPVLGKSNITKPINGTNDLKRLTSIEDNFLTAPTPVIETNSKECDN